MDKYINVLAVNENAVAELDTRSAGSGVGYNIIARCTSTFDQNRVTTLLNMADGIPTGDFKKYCFQLPQQVPCRREFGDPASEAYMARGLLNSLQANRDGGSRDTGELEDMGALFELVPALDKLMWDYVGSKRWLMSGVWCYDVLDGPKATLELFDPIVHSFLEGTSLADLHRVCRNYLDSLEGVFDVDNSETPGT